MSSNYISIEEAKRIDMVAYLETLGHTPQKITNNDYWYLSPLRTEKTPSFKINRRLNVFFDHGIGKGGTIIDFGILYFNCTVKDFLQKLSAWQNASRSFHTPQSNALVKTQASNSLAGEKKEAAGSVIVQSVRPLASAGLLTYLHKRHIPVDIAADFCKEVVFTLYNKTHIAIGFPNNMGGFELRNENFKGSSSPKGISFINNDSGKLAVFEGFFSFLSFQVLNRKEPPLANFLILNSLAFFQKAKEKMDAHQHVHLFLDRDAAGIRHTQDALQWDGKYIDRSHFYTGRKDLNDWLIHHEQIKQQSVRRGRGI